MPSASASSPNPPKPPEEPHPDECCNRGCCPCVFDYYQDALDRWKAAVLALGCDPAILLARAREPGETP